MSAEFLLTSLVVVLVPGTGVLYTLACGLSRGLRASVAAAFGCTLGIVPHLTASILGLAALLHTSAVAFQFLKIAGVAYLLYMAWCTLRETGALKVDESVTARSLRAVAVRGTLINILNPKLSIFFLAFLPLFVSADTNHPTLEMIGLAGVFMAMTFIVFIGYGACAASARKYVIAKAPVMAWMRRAFAGAFVVLGFRLAVAEPD